MFEIVWCTGTNEHTNAATPAFPTGKLCDAQGQPQANPELCGAQGRTQAPEIKKPHPSAFSAARMRSELCDAQGHQLQIPLHVLLAPIIHRIENRHEALPLLRQGILHFRRHDRVHFAVDD